MGPRGSKVKLKVKVGRGTGGGLTGTNRRGCGPLRWSENHHQGGGGDYVTAAAGQPNTPATYLGGRWGPGKKSK